MPRKLPCASASRWWSELPLDEVLEEDELHHRDFLASYEQGEYLHLRLTKEERSLLQIYNSTLRPLEKVTSAMSAETYVTASALLPVVYALERSQEKAATESREDPEPWSGRDDRPIEAITARKERVSRLIV